MADQWAERRRVEQADGILGGAPHRPPRPAWLASRDGVQADAEQRAVGPRRSGAVVRRARPGGCGGSRQVPAAAPAAHRQRPAPPGRCPRSAGRYGGARPGGPTPRGRAPAAPSPDALASCTGRGGTGDQGPGSPRPVVGRRMRGGDEVDGMRPDEAVPRRPGDWSRCARRGAWARADQRRPGAATAPVPRPPARRPPRPAGTARQYVAMVVLCVYFVRRIAIRLVGEGGVDIATRVMGIVLAALAVQYVLNGVTGYYHLLLGR